MSDRRVAGALEAAGLSEWEELIPEGELRVLGHHLLFCVI
jgi:hypothetical protein